MPGVSDGALRTVPRPAVCARLDEGCGRQLTLISAPAGFGKSTVLAEWAQLRGATRRFVVLRLDARDADPVRMLTRLASAIGEDRAAVDDPPQLVEHPNPVVSARLADVLAAIDAATEPLTIVLDDFHVAEGPVVDEAIGLLIAHRSPHADLVVSTRRDPALALGRLKTADQLAEVRASHLAFTIDEIGPFFDGAGVVGLTDEQLQRLHARTEGWPAPLRLAALLMTDARDRDGVVDAFTGTNRLVVDYMTTDVLDLLPPERRNFVLRASILDRLNASLCDSVMEIDDSGQILAELERANFFVSTDAADPGWYRLHSLFADALAMRLARSGQSVLDRLHGRAAAWLEEHGDLEAATDHAIAARDLPLASRLVSLQMQPLSASGRWPTTRRWLDRLAWPEALADPELAYARAAEASVSTRPADVGRWLDIAATGPRQKVVAGMPLGFRVDVLRATICVGDIGTALRCANRALDDAPDQGLRGLALAARGQAHYLNGDLEAAADDLRVAVASIPETIVLLLAGAVANLSLVESALGEIDRSTRLLGRTEEILESIGSRDSPAGALVDLARGAGLLAAGRAPDAVGPLRRAVELFGTADGNGWLANALLYLAAALLAAGELDGADDAIDRAETVLTRLPDPGAMSSRCADLRDQLERAGRIVAGFGEPLSARELDVLRLAVTGLSQREIGAELYISYNTVKTHLRSSYRKLGVTSKDDAVRKFVTLDQDDSVVPPG